MFGVGTVDFDTAGTDDSEFRFEWINKPGERGAGGGRGDARGVAAAATAGRADRLG